MPDERGITDSKRQQAGQTFSLVKRRGLSVLVPSLPD